MPVAAAALTMDVSPAGQGVMLGFALLLGGGLGLLCKGRIPKTIAENMTRAVGLCVCVIGIFSALQGDFMLLESLATAELVLESPSANAAVLIRILSDIGRTLV